MDARISLLGGFSVSVGGSVVTDQQWSRRNASMLVKVLALAKGRRLHREQVIDLLWPDLSPDTAAPRLHQAAHYARRALAGAPGQGVVLRHDFVELLPEGDVSVDAVEFRAAAEATLANADSADGAAATAAAALEQYGGVLLPDDLYEPWAQEHRESLEQLHRDLLRLTGRWEELVAADPADEEAHLTLARAHADRGDVRAALRQLERLELTLRRELGTALGVEAESLRAELMASQTAAATSQPGAAATVPAPAAAHGIPPATEATRSEQRRLVGRRAVGDTLRERLAKAQGGRGGAVLVTGPPGVGKSSVLDLSEVLAQRAGWRTGRGTASAVEGPWPYAPVLEALGDLCRRHPALLDGLDDRYRAELDRALSERQVSWSGESAHQGLFVAAAELLRLGAAGRGLLLVFDDVHEADEASLRLLHYLARCAASDQVLLVLAHRPTRNPALEEVHTSLVARGIGSRIDIEPLTEEATLRLLAERFPGLDQTTQHQIWAVSGGLPFTALELGSAAAAGREPTTVSSVPPDALRALQRAALLGLSFSTDEFLAVSGVSETQAYHHLETAQASLVIEWSETGYQFRHALVREAVLDTMPPAAQSAARVEVARELARLGASPARIAHQYLAAGQPRQAIPYVLPAVETSGALGAYRDALNLVEEALAVATGEMLGHLLARRGDLLTALGDPAAAASYRDAVPLTTGAEHRLVRARLARAACFASDFDTARSALAGLELLDDEADGPIMLARGNLAYFSGDIDGAWDHAVGARESLLTPKDPFRYVDLIALQGMIAHQRGEWFERFRIELRRTLTDTGLTTALFDAHLCIAEYLLYGGVPYGEVIELATFLRQRSLQFGALRGVAFTTALVGEAALLMGDLDLAERELQEAVDLHRDVDAPAGESHALQRLAEVRLAQGDRDEATRLLNQALSLARWSIIGMHLLQRIHGSMVLAASDPVAARAAVERAEASMGEADVCPFCAVTFEVPATIACAGAGDLDAAERHLAAAELSAAKWEGTAWPAAVLEAKAHLAAARGDADHAASLLTEAADLFGRAGQPLDAARCASQGALRLSDRPQARAHEQGASAGTMRA
jgi:DNA-binding SARP family transcriptional activator/predicted negative regulator of RcsB-dependent stress response